MVNTVCNPVVHQTQLYRFVGVLIMKLSTRLLFSTVAIAIAPLVQAQAADMDLPVYVEDAPEYVPVEIGSGWYLRGDIGYSFATGGGPATYRTFNPGPATYTNNTFATTDFESDMNYSVGFGYQYNDWLRTDVTLDRFKGDFDGTTTSAVPCPGGVLGTTCRSEEASQFTAYSTMLNGYFDLGTFSGFTPYVGGGAGVTRVSWGNLTSNTYCVDGAVICGAGLVATTAHNGMSSWRFTYALMAGVAYDATDNLKIDLGYKYRKIASGPMFQFDAASMGVGATGTQGTDGGIENHVVTLGVRYALW